MYGKRLKKLRENLYLPIRYINSLIASDIEKVENDQEFLTYGEIIFLAKAYGVSENYIMVGENFPKAPKGISQEEYEHVLRFKKRLKEKLDNK